MFSRFWVLRMLVPAGTALLAAPAFATLGGGTDDGVSYIRVALAFFVSIAVAVVAALVLRKRTGGVSLRPFLPATQRRLQLKESIKVSPQHQLSIIACDGAEMLVMTSPSGTELLRDLPPAEGDAR